MSMTYEVTLNMAVPQAVRCTHCGTEYVYDVHVSCFASSDNGVEADRTARERLAYALKGSGGLCGAVPCPKCHRYQPYMIPQMARERYNRLGCLAAVLKVLGFLVAVGPLVLWFAKEKEPKLLAISAVGLIAFVAGFVLSRRQAKLIASYDPNAGNPAEREKVAKEKALPPEVHEAVQALRFQAAYNESQGPPPATPPRRPLRPDPAAPDARVFELWVKSSVLKSGATLAVPLSETEMATVVVPAGTESGTPFEACVGGRPVPALRVRVNAISVHRSQLPQE